jgi:hypothetical protein
MAGCTGDSEDKEAAEAELEQAADYIKQNATMLDEYDKAVSLSSLESVPRFDHRSFKNNIELARGHVDEAEATAPGAYGDTISYYRDTLNYQTEVGKANDLLQQYLECLATVESMLGAERWEDAANHHPDCVDTLRDVESQLETVLELLDTIERQDLPENAQIEYDIRAENIMLAKEEFPPLFDFHEGYQLFLDGATEYFASATSFENEATAAAKRGFSRAEGRFADAANIYEDLDTADNLPDGLRPTIIDMQCYSSAFEESTSHWYNAVEAYENGNKSRYNNEIEAARSALDTCE